MPPKSERQLRREEPLPEASTSSAQQPSLAASKPHVAPDQAVKAKSKRAKSSASNKRKQEAKLAAIERAQKLEKRRTDVGSKKEKKKQVRQLWS